MLSGRGDGAAGAPTRLASKSAPPTQLSLARPGRRRSPVRGHWHGPRAHQSTRVLKRDGEGRARCSLDARRTIGFKLPSASSLRVHSRLRVWLFSKLSADSDVSESPCHCGTGSGPQKRVPERPSRCFCFWRRNEGHGVWVEASCVSSLRWSSPSPVGSFVVQVISTIMMLAAASGLHRIL